MTGYDVASIVNGLQSGSVIPYLGPGVLALDPANNAVPSSADALVQRLVEKVSVPHKIRNNLTAAAQFIENFKHRRTVVNLMKEAFSAPGWPTDLHRYLAALPNLPVIVNAWYDSAMASALEGRRDWGQIQGLSQAEHFGRWTQCYDAAGAAVDDHQAEHWATLLYQPLGSIAPAENFLVSDSDFVEVLTEIDIQTPIPGLIQQRRQGRSFLFLGCRFANQLERTFARQTMKRSSDIHWAVLPTPPTKNEARFLSEQNIRRIDVPLAEFVAALLAATTQDRRQRAAHI